MRNVQSNVQQGSVAFYQLFKFADGLDKFLLAVSITLAVGFGALNPLFVVQYGLILNSLVTFNLEGISEVILNIVYIGIGALFLNFIAAFAIQLSAQRQIKFIRRIYFKAVMKQDLDWFAEHSSGALLNKISDNTEDIHNAISLKFISCINQISTFVCSMAVSIYLGWELSLIGCLSIPLITVAFALMALTMKRFVALEKASYEKAGKIATDALTAIKTVGAFGLEDYISKRYEDNLEDAAAAQIRKEVSLGLTVGVATLVLYSSIAVLFFVGVEFIVQNENLPRGRTTVYNSGNVSSIILFIIIAASGLGVGLSAMRDFFTGKAAAFSVFQTISRVPKIDKDKRGVIFDNLKGKIEFRNVDFHYETRKESKILKDFNLTLKPGKVTALIGPSGSGKSTILQLIQRLYDPINGQIFIDGVNLADVDLKAYRKSIGVVSQDPVLFSGTIFENIQLGRSNATREDIVEAAKCANAHDFIIKLEKGYETHIGEGGGNLSGGQKQRITIARALVKKPHLLLLDEATSALDNKSEKAVQSAIDSASKNRTVVLIAHRLSTVRSADEIIVLDQGQVIERGNHVKLYRLGGKYYEMLRKERIKSVNDETNITSYTTIPSLIREKQELTVSKINIDPDTSINEDAEDVSVIRNLLTIGREEIKFIVIGSMFSILSAFTQPAFAFIFSEMFKVFRDIVDGSEFATHQKVVALLFVFLALAKMVVLIMSYYFFGKTGSRITKKIRSKLFKAILYQEMAWFDRDENQSGILSTRLAVEASKLHSVIGSSFGSVLEMCLLITISLSLSFWFSWELTLVNLFIFPIVILLTSLQSRNLNRNEMDKKKIKSASFVKECLNFHKVITIESLENEMLEKYTEYLDKTNSMREIVILSLLHSLANSISYFQLFIQYKFGLYLMEKGRIDFVAIFRTFNIFQFAVRTLTNFSYMAQDAINGYRSAKEIFRTIKRKPKIEINKGVIPRDLSCEIEFKNVNFAYPSRGENRVLKNLGHTFLTNKSTGCVGYSGSGKSTIIQLIQRFYDIEDVNSEILFYQTPIKQIQPKWIRQQIGIVSQEAMLFDLTIRENIELGLIGITEEKVDFDRVVEAAKQANAHDFIMSLPKNYDTRVGEMSSQLSGGQRQRIAIARAMIRKPKILLLDEATSALDNENESIVEKSIESALKDGEKTSIIVAHRLGTIEKSDQIVLMREGRIIEKGKNEELLKRRGHYYQMYSNK